VRVPVTSRSASLDSTWMLWLDRHGKSRLGLSERAWSVEQLLTLPGQRRLPVDALEQTLNLRDLRERYPGSIPWWLTYPVVAVLAGITILIAIPTAIAAL